MEDDITNDRVGGFICFREAVLYNSIISVFHYLLSALLLFHNCPSVTNYADCRASPEAFGFGLRPALIGGWHGFVIFIPHLHSSILGPNLQPCSFVLLKFP